MILKPGRQGAHCCAFPRAVRPLHNDEHAGIYGLAECHLLSLAFLTRIARFLKCRISRAPPRMAPPGTKRMVAAKAACFVILMMTFKLHVYGCQQDQSHDPQSDREWNG